jgi:NAD(P)-dependent dehydrogenase (short-subunit alcohol dehydrogenase family)
LSVKIQEPDMTADRRFAIVTGASTGIGYELAKCCAQQGFDLLIAADEPAIERAAAQLRSIGVLVEAVQADLATEQGVDELVRAAKDGRSTRFSPMPGAAWATPFLIRILTTRAG